MSVDETRSRSDPPRVRSLSASDTDTVRRLRSLQISASARRPTAVLESVERSDRLLEAMTLSQYNRHRALAATTIVQRRLDFEAFSSASPNLSASSSSSAQRLLRELTREQHKRWNFDFESSRPLRGRYHWSTMGGLRQDGCGSGNGVFPIDPNFGAFVPVDCCVRLAADSDDLSWNTWRKPTTTMPTTNAQTQTRPEAETRLPIDAFAIVTPQVQVDMNNNINASVVMDVGLVTSTRRRNEVLSGSRQKSRCKRKIRSVHAPCAASSSSRNVERLRRKHIVQRYRATTIKHYFQSVKRVMSNHEDIKHCSL